MRNILLSGERMPCRIERCNRNRAMFTGCHGKGIKGTEIVKRNI